VQTGRSPPLPRRTFPRRILVSQVSFYSLYSIVSLFMGYYGVQLGVIPDGTIFLFVALSRLALLAHKTYSVIMREFFPLW
jgi:hypothetical protein